MKYVLYFFVGVTLMTLIDRAIWRQYAIFLSVERKIDGWSEIEDNMAYRYNDPIKIIIFLLIAVFVLSTVRHLFQTWFNVTALIVITCGYLLYTFKMASAAFESAVLERCSGKLAAKCGDSGDGKL